MREVVLDRSSNTVRLTEDFELAKRGPVTLSLMTSRVPSERGRGVFVLHAAKPGGKDVSLKYDGAALGFSMEKIELQDEGMRRSWGTALYRVQLRTLNDVDRARWTMEIAG
jgi:hypothetical protein